MAFCNNCGYLLPADFSNQIILCKPCLESYKGSQEAKACDCEFCRHSHLSTEQNSRASIISKKENSFSSLSVLQRHGRNNKRTKHKKVVSFRDKEDEDGNMALSFGSTEGAGEIESEEKNQTEIHDQQLDPLATIYGIADYCPDYSIVDSDVTNSWGCDPGHPNEDWGWSPDDKVSNDMEIDINYHDVLSKDNNSDKKIYGYDPDGCDMITIKRKGASLQFESSSGVSVNHDRKEDQVSEEIREKWTREQAEYLKELRTEDPPTIHRLISGQRRKADGSRFYVGGVDISFIKDNKVDACACLSVVQMPDLELVYQRMEMIQLTQPYIPGFLAFREVPPLLTLFDRLKKAAPFYMPDVVMVDGNGILHPRGFGLASHLGVELNLPTIGVAKTLMTAQGVTDDETHKKRKKNLKEAGDGFDLISQTTGKSIGKCVRVHDAAPNPIYVSIGHNISLSSAVWIVLENSKYRIPEPVRRADLDSREYIRQNNTKPQEYIKL